MLPWVIDRIDPELNRKIRKWCDADRSVRKERICQRIDAGHRPRDRRAAGRVRGGRVRSTGATRRASRRCVDELRAEQPDARFEGAAADVATAEGAAALFEALPSVDILVNNLGIFGPVPLLEVADELWQRYWDVNVMSGDPPDPPLHRRHARARLGARAVHGRDSAVVIPEEMVHYGVTKTALLGVSRGFAKVVAGSGVTVNAVIAGPTHTEGVEDFVRELVGDEQPWDEASAKFVKRAPPDVADRAPDRAGRDREPVRLPGSDLASATTGGALRVDGGFVDNIVL